MTEQTKAISIEDKNMRMIITFSFASFAAAVGNDEEEIKAMTLTALASLQTRYIMRLLNLDPDNEKDRDFYYDMAKEISLSMSDEVSNELQNIKASAQSINPKAG